MKQFSELRESWQQQKWNTLENVELVWLVFQSFFSFVLITCTTRSASEDTFPKWIGQNSEDPTDTRPELDGDRDRTEADRPPPILLSEFLTIFRSQFCSSQSGSGPTPRCRRTLRLVWNWILLFLDSSIPNERSRLRRGSCSEECCLDE